MGKAEKIPEGYRVTEAGILPVDWQVKRLSEVATELTERAGQDKYETVSISAGVGFVNQAEKFGKELSGKQYEKYIVLHQGDFSYNKGNSKTFPQGCIYRLNDRETAAVPNVFESFRIEDQDADYYEQLFLSGFLNKQLYSKINRGVRDDGLLNLTGKDFYSCMVPVPPIAEQKKIAEILAQCDKVVELYQCKIDELKKLKKACLNMVFPEKGSMMPQIRFPGFKGPWKKYQLGEISTFITKGTTPTTYGFSWQNDGIPFFRNDCIRNNIFVYGDFSYISEGANEALQRSEIQGNDILIAITGDIGKVGIVPESIKKANINQHIARIRTKSIEPYFVYQYLASDVIQNDYKKIKTGISMPQLSLEQIRETTISVPSTAEQRRIAAFLKEFDNLISLDQQTLGQWKQKKKFLMQTLLTGIVRIKC